MKQPLTTYVILSTTIALLLTPLFPLKAPYLLAIAIIAIFSEYLFDKLWESTSGFALYVYKPQCPLSPHGCIYNLPMWYWGIGILLTAYHILKQVHLIPPVSPKLVFPYLLGMLLLLIILKTQRKSLTLTLLPQIVILAGVFALAPKLGCFSLIAGTVAHVLEVSVNIAIRKLTGSFVWTYHGPLTYYQNATSLINIAPFALASLYFIALGEILGVFI